MSKLLKWIAISSLIKTLLIISLSISAPILPSQEPLPEFIVIEGNSFLAKKIPPEMKLNDKIRVVADKYGLNYNELLAVIKCESGICQDHKTCFGDNGLSFGLAQFQRKTWEKYCQGDYLEATAEDQLECMAKMWQAGLKNHWACWRKLN